jgi:hypothetical protein
VIEAGHSRWVSPGYRTQAVLAIIEIAFDAPSCQIARSRASPTVALLCLAPLC